MSVPRTHAVLRRLGAFAASLAVSVVVAELVVERFMPVGGQTYAADPELLFDALPSTRRVQAMPPAAVREGDAARVIVETNSAGFRGPELDPARRRPRVLVLGDSFVMAENVPERATFVRRLEGELTARMVAAAARAGGGDDPDVAHKPRPTGAECVNAGRSGYGPDQALLLAERRIADVAPDALLLVLCSGNDLGDLARNKLVSLDPSGALVRHRPRLAPHIVRDFQERSARAARPALLRLVDFHQLRREHAAWPPAEDPSLLPLYDELLRGQFHEHFVAQDPTVSWLFEDIYDAVQALEPDGEVARREQALLTAVLRSLADLARRRGIPCGVVVTPAAPDLVPGLLVRITPESHPGYTRGTLPRLHREAAIAAGLRVLDVTEAFAAHPDPSILFVGGEDPHWNAAGQALAARVVADGLAGWPELLR